MIPHEVVEIAELINPNWKEEESPSATLAAAHRIYGAGFRREEDEITGMMEG